MKETMRDKINNLITEKYDQYLEFAKNMQHNSEEEPSDILNEVLLSILEKSDSNVAKILDYLDWYIIKAIKYSYTSRTSAYQQKYNKILIDKNTHNINHLEGIDYNVSKKIVNELRAIDLNEEYNYEQDEQLELIENNMKNLSWYEKEVFTQKLKRNIGFKKMSKETGIPETSLYLTYKKAVEKLKQNGETK